MRVTKNITRASDYDHIPERYKIAKAVNACWERLGTGMNESQFRILANREPLKIKRS